MNSALAAWPPRDGMERFLSRRFATSRVDLDIDFDTPRPLLVTAILANCLRNLDAQSIDVDSLWNWTVVERLQGLLAVALISTGSVTAAVAVCSNEACRNQVELELGLSGFAEEAPQSKIAWTAPDGQSHDCCLPTGLDQRDWLEHTQTDGKIDAAWWINRLLQNTQNLASTPAPNIWLDALGKALAEADPLTGLCIDTTCPFCEQLLRVDIDLEWLLIEGLRSQQRRLIEQVHRLALNYHWSETEIVDLPGWRREGYLSRVEAEWQ